MINGLFLDPRTWKIDYTTSPFWNPNKFGLQIDLHNNAFAIPNIGIDKKYKFVVASEVWEIPMQKTLEYLRKKGLKIFLVPREIAPTKAHSIAMFSHERYKYKDVCYFTPDFVFAASQQYADLWINRAPVEVIGYPRFDIYLDPSKSRTKDQILERHGIEKNKKIIFFPAYPPYAVQIIDGKMVNVDLFNDLTLTLRGLEEYALSHPDVQVISKIHPMSFKCYQKNMGNKKEVAGLLKKYYEHPTKHMKVIGDIRNDSSVAREMIIIADAVVGYTSMMLLEAIIMNKPIVHTKFPQCSALKDTLEFENDILTAYTPQEMIDYLDLNDDRMLEHNIKLVEKYIYKVDGKFCDRLCNGIKRELK